MTQQRPLFDEDRKWRFEAVRTGFDPTETLGLAGMQPAML
jgi:hypothetical protein